MSTDTSVLPQIAVVIPCYRVKKHILDVLARIPSEVSNIYVVDDCCPENSGELVKKEVRDPRVKVIHHQENKGVGGAMITGYQIALEDGADICVKIDGDGQMPPELLHRFVKPLISQIADYTKGNRFFDIEKVRAMPWIRLLGNAGLSFVNKAVSGYWGVMDPTNGYTAINRAALSMLALDKVSNRYFFESDLLFRLGTIKAVVLDIPMEAHYGEEKSNLSVRRVAFEFPFLYISRFFKRIFYGYFLRDFSIASLELIAGLVLLSFGISFGLYSWYNASTANEFASTGTVMLASLPIIVGIQLLLSFISFDMSNQPSTPLSKKFE